MLGLEPRRMRNQVASASLRELFPRRRRLHFLSQHRPAHIIGGNSARSAFVTIFIACGGVASLLWASEPAAAATIDECREQLIAGKYAECIEATGEAIRDRKYGESWPILNAQAEIAIGRYAAARSSVEAGLKRYRWSVRLRLVAHDIYLHTGNATKAKLMLAEINEMAGRFPWRYSDEEDLVALGRAALIMRADARTVLEGFFDRAKKYNPRHRLPYLATGQLALDKNDLPLAAEIFQEALKQFPNDPDVHFGLAQALGSSDPQRAALSMAKTLELNPRHVPCLLAAVDRLIDSEQYAEAENQIAHVLEINPKQSTAWAYRAVLAHLENDPRGEVAFRDAALATWKQNSAVDHLIGKKLSQKYRFREGAAHQRRALEFDKTYLPAQIQLSQDLLRLGEEDAGWELANAVYENDGYDVVTFNLVELRDKLAKFRTLENDAFIVRMDAHEADVYGKDVLELLSRAKQVLCAKYGLELKRQITVEIFPEQNDFAVRTFGMPAVSGFLGVCFGTVILELRFH